MEECAMRAFLSSFLMDDVMQTVDAALHRYGIVNVPQLAEEIRRRNVAENVALEDIEARVLMRAQARGAAMEF
jgi:hypothetical protein